MTNQSIAQKLGMYTKELGMGIERRSVVDIANSASPMQSLSRFFVFLQEEKVYFRNVNSFDSVQR